MNVFSVYVVQNKKCNLTTEENYKLKKYKNEHNNKLVFKLKFITLKDYDELNPYDAIIYDKRSFLTLFWDKLKEENILINLMFHSSILEPLWIRWVLFYFNLSLIFLIYYCYLRGLTTEPGVVSRT